MINNAFDWARENGHLRTNHIHREEEAQLVLSDTFELMDETGSSMDLSGGMEMQDWDYM